MNERIKQVTIDSSETIITALKRMDNTHHKLLVVLKDNQYISVISIGDIQRAIINNINLENQISTILRKNTTKASIHETPEKVKTIMKERRIEFMPIVDDEGNLFDVIFWNDLYQSSFNPDRPKLDMPVVIMAGGKGTRLNPLTNVIPKPLIPIGDKTILEEIMDQFESIGCTKFYMSVNYKVDMMKFYLDQIEHKYNITFFQEDKPLGTIGSVSLLKGKIDNSFFVSNCDIIIDQDYRDVYEYHVNNKNDITIVTALKSNVIPYGVIETGKDGLMLSLREKPETTFMFNTGVYLLNNEMIDEIPDGFFHITDLIDKVKKNGGRVGCFPVSEHSWKDIGKWSEYLKTIGYLDKV